MNVINTIEQFARRLPLGSPPVVVGHPYYGKIGLCLPSKGFQLTGMSPKVFERILWESQMPASVRAARGLGAITTWDGVLASRAAGKADDRICTKGSQTTVANCWANFYRSTGMPGAGAYSNIPGGAAHNALSAGAMPLTKPTSPDKKYLLNFGVQHLTGTNVVLLIDLLVAANNILLTTTNAQDVSTTALTRYTDGLGVMMAFEITTATSATAVNITVAYKDEGNNASSIGPVAFQTAVATIVYRLAPTLAAAGGGGAFVTLANGDFGVRSVTTVTFSAALAAGKCTVLLYKPLVLIPTLATTTYVERSTPGMLGGITELVTESGGDLGCLTVLVLPSTTSTGVQTYFLQTCAG